LKGIEKEKHGNSIQIKSFFYLYPYSVPSSTLILLPKKEGGKFWFIFSF
jgi:hypothetical protein